MKFEAESSILDKAKQVIHEGNVRHVVLEKEGRRIIDLPLTLIIIAAVLAPWLLAILLVAALLLEYRVSIENTETLESTGDDLHGMLDTGKDAVDSAAEGVKSATDAAAEGVDSAADAVKSATDSATDAVKSATGSVADSAKSVTDSAAKSAKSAADNVDDAISR